MAKNERSPIVRLYLASAVQRLPFGDRWPILEGLASKCVSFLLSFCFFCISNPMNTEKVVSTVAEEVQRMLDSGVTGEELDNAKSGYLENRQRKRADDASLAEDLLTNLKTDRTMEFQADKIS